MRYSGGRSRRIRGITEGGRDWGFGPRESSSRCLMLHCERKSRFCLSESLIPNPESPPHPCTHTSTRASARPLPKSTWLNTTDEHTPVPHSLIHITSSLLCL